MGDVADILGFNKQPTSGSGSAILDEINAKTIAPNDKKKVAKPKGMSREVFSLLGKDGLTPSIQSNSMVASNAFKTKWTNSLKGKWIWAPITPFSARS